MAAITQLSLTATPGRAYGSFAGKVFAGAVVSTRYDLDGANDKNFSLVGIDNQSFVLEGADNRNILLVGD